MAEPTDWEMQARQYLRDPLAAQLGALPPLEEWGPVVSLSRYLARISGTPEPKMRGGLANPDAHAVVERVAEGWTGAELRQALDGAMRDDYVRARPSMWRLAVLLRDASVVHGHRLRAIAAPLPPTEQSDDVPGVRLPSSGRIQTVSRARCRQLLLTLEHLDEDQEACVAAALPPAEIADLRARRRAVAERLEAKEEVAALLLSDPDADVEQLAPAAVDALRHDHWPEQLRRWRAVARRRREARAPRPLPRAPEVEEAAVLAPQLRGEAPPSGHELLTADEVASLLAAMRRGR